MRDRADRRCIFLVLTSKAETVLETLSVAHRQQLRFLPLRLTRLL